VRGRCLVWPPPPSTPVPDASVNDFRHILQQFRSICFNPSVPASVSGTDLCSTVYMGYLILLRH
jgi:hypothetical protein